LSRRSQDQRNRHNSVACGAAKLTIQKAATLDCLHPLGKKQAHKCKRDEDENGR